MIPDASLDSTDSALEQSYEITKGPSIARMAVWDFVGRIANFGITFIVGILLTRLLAPEEFGVFSVVLAIVLFSNVFLDFGFRIALIQAKRVTQTQLSTVFFLNMIVGAVIFTIIGLSSNSIAAFYDNENLAKPLIVLSTLFVFNSLTLIPNVLLSRAMRFKSIAIVNTIAAIVSGSLGVSLAYSGFKVWALITQTLANSIIVLIGLSISAGWKPAPKFVLKSVIPLRKLSATVFSLTILDSFYSRMDVFIIGRVFNMSTLGFYTRAQSVDGLVRNFSVGTLGAIILPYFSKIQDDVVQLRHYYKRSVNLVLFVAFLVSGVLFLGSLDIIIILFTDKWAIVASYFKIIAITSFGYPLSVIMVNIIVARGNSKEFIKLELVKRIIMTPGFLFIIFGNIYGFLIAQLVLNCININVNSYFVGKEIGVSKIFTLKVVGTYGGLALGCGVFAFLVSSNFSDRNIIHLLVVTATFTLPYFVTAYYLKLDGIMEGLDKARELILERRMAT